MHRRDDRLVRLARCAPYLVVLSLLAVAGMVLLHRYNVPRARPRVGLPHLGDRHTLVRAEFTEPLIGALFPLVGWRILRRQPANAIGWICLSASVIAAKSFLGEYAVTAYLVHPGIPLGAVAAWLTMWGWTPYLLLMSLVPLLYPDGRLPSPRWRWVAIATCVAFVCAVVALSLADAPIDSSDFIDNPLGLTAAGWYKSLFFAFIGSFFLFFAPVSVIALVVRTKRARGPERAQALWGLVGGMVLVVSHVGLLGMNYGPADAIDAVSFIAVAVSLVVGTTFYGEARRDRVLNRTLVYAVLTVLALVGYAGVVTIVNVLVPGHNVGVGAIAVIALLAAMGRDRVQRWIDQLLYGERRDPYAVVSRVSGRLDVATGPLDALASLVSELAAALKLPYVAVLPDDDALPVAMAGARVDDVEAIPVTSQGRPIGTLEVGHRQAREKFRDAETSVLRDVAGRAGALLYAAGLVDDLQRSRERIVAAREEERRRLRHDLHDGLGPQLAAMALQLEALAGRLDGDADAARRVASMRDRMREMVSEVRRVVDDLRPAALDQLGLVDALRQHAATLQAPVSVGATASRALTIEVAAGELPELPAAAEVAAYRIATEALTNAVRHAAAGHCVVTVSMDGPSLVVAVADDGHGIPESMTPGVGLQSMRERAAELGGEFAVVSTDDGTVVSTRLPVEAR